MKKKRKKKLGIGGHRAISETSFAMDQSLILRTHPPHIHTHTHKARHSYKPCHSSAGNIETVGDRQIPGVSGPDSRAYLESF